MSSTHRSRALTRARAGNLSSFVGGEREVFERYLADRYGPPIFAGDYDPSFTVRILAVRRIRAAGAGRQLAGRGFRYPRRA
jgi:hypothetical protein